LVPWRLSKQKKKKAEEWERKEPKLNLCPNSFSFSDKDTKGERGVKLGFVWWRLFPVTREASLASWPESEGVSYLVTDSPADLY